MTQKASHQLLEYAPALCKKKFCDTNADARSVCGS